MPALGRVLLAAGAVALGDSRIENIERLRADGIDAPIVLIRSPLPSEVERVVAAADTSCNTEVEIVELLSAAAVRAGRVHGVMLMVELGDLREGIMPVRRPRRRRALPRAPEHRGSRHRHEPRLSQRRRSRRSQHG